MNAGCWNVQNAPLIVKLLARAVLLMLYGVPEFVSNKAIRILPSPVIPLLSFQQIINLRLGHKCANHTHLMAHNALMPTFPTSIPLFKVTVVTFAIPHTCKVKEDDDVLSLWFGVFP